MGRKKKDQGGAASAPRTSTLEELSDDQRYSLTAQHRDRYLLLYAAKTTADTALKNHGKIVRADLGKDGLAEIKALIEGATPEGEATIKARVERELRILRWLGVPIGTQGGLFEGTDRTPITERAFAEGKRQGLAGESPNNPHHHTTEAHRSFNDGWAAGQETKATKGFSKLEPKPDGDPKPSFVDKMRAQNDAVQEAIKTGTVHKLGDKAAAADSLAAN